MGVRTSGVYQWGCLVGVGGKKLALIALHSKGGFRYLVPLWGGNLCIGKLLKKEAGILRGSHWGGGLKKN